MPKQQRGTLEVHGHAVLSGPLYQAGTRDITHAHEGGDRAHRHPGTGPAHYTIDRDEWAAATGMKGGGRKEYSAKPTGPQLPLEEPDEAQGVFRVVFVDEYTEAHRSAGISEERFAAERAAFLAEAQAPAVARMTQGFYMKPVYEIHPPIGSASEGRATCTGPGKPADRRGGRRRAAGAGDARRTRRRVTPWMLHRKEIAP